MKISVIVNENDARVAIVPETVGKYINLGFDVILPKNIGTAAGFNDDEYEAAGAKIQKTPIIDADFYLCVKLPFQKGKSTSARITKPTKSQKNFGLKAGTNLIGLLSPFKHEKMLGEMIADGINLYALEFVPRITRAQTMDVLSSQASIVGYRAVLEALSEYNKVVPLMMTAAGTIRPANVLVIGAGVAGLQAIATAKRLGAVVSAFDVRNTVKEQVESLGAAFIQVDIDENGETPDGYAKEMSDEYKVRQAEKLANVISKSDIVITTAQIQGKPAPILITKKMVESMQMGSVIVDIATEAGGNCELSKKDEVIKIHGVTIIGDSNIAAKVAHDSSRLFAKNILNFVALMIKDGKIDISDEIVAATQIKKA